MNQPLPGMPDNPEFTQDHNIPRRAGSLLHMLMDDFQRLWDLTMAYPSKVEGDERRWVINRQVDLFVQVYLLADPAPVGSQHPEPSAGEPDWRRVAVKMARTGADFYGLTTVERDALEAALAEPWGAL